MCVGSTKAAVKQQRTLHHLKSCLNSTPKGVRRVTRTQIADWLLFPTQHNNRRVPTKNLCGSADLDCWLGARRRSARWARSWRTTWTCGGWSRRRTAHITGTAPSSTSPTTSSSSERRQGRASARSLVRSLVPSKPPLSPQPALVIGRCLPRARTQF